MMAKLHERVEHLAAVAAQQYGLTDARCLRIIVIGLLGASGLPLVALAASVVIIADVATGIAASRSSGKHHEQVMR